jgi:hypothetical protein
MPFEQRLGGAEFGEDLRFVHGPFPGRCGRRPDKPRKGRLQGDPRALRRTGLLPIRPANPPLGPESVPLRALVSQRV